MSPLPQLHLILRVAELSQMNRTARILLTLPGGGGSARSAQSAIRDGVGCAASKADRLRMNNHPTPTASDEAKLRPIRLRSFFPSLISSSALAQSSSAMAQPQAGRGSALPMPRRALSQFAALGVSSAAV